MGKSDSLLTTIIMFISANGWRVYEMYPLQNIYSNKVRYEHHLHHFEGDLLEDIISYGLELKKQTGMQVTSPNLMNN